MVLTYKELVNRIEISLLDFIRIEKVTGETPKDLMIDLLSFIHKQKDLIEIHGE